MKKGIAYYSVAFLLLFFTALFLLAGCIREVIFPEDDKYTSFPEAQILGASFFYQVNNQDVSGDEAGMISRNEDGSYNVKMKRRSPPNVPSAMYITGSFEFSEFFKMVCTFPDSPAIADKPYRVYACASRKMDANLDADYPTAVDLVGTAAFRTGEAIGEFTLTNEGINYLNPDRWGRPYITVFLYLYFNNVSNPDDYYEFTLNFAGGANGYTPASKVTKAEIYRSGDTENKFILETTVEEKPDLNTSAINYITHPILARYNHRFDSNKITPAIPVIDTPSLRVDLTVADEDEGMEIEFDIRNVGLFQSTVSPAPADSNLITKEMILSAKALGAGGGEAPECIVTERLDNSSSPAVPFYRVKTKVVDYGDMTGVRLIISGTEPEELFTGTSRFTITILVPEKYVGEE